MSVDDDQLILDALAGRRPNSRGLVRANCPMCVLIVGKADRKGSMQANLASGAWKCFRCDAWGRLRDVPEDVARRTPGVCVEPARSMNLPEGFVPMWQDEGKGSLVCAPARHYLAKRGVTGDVVEAARVGVCVRGRFAGRVVVPIYKEGKLAGYVGRSLRRKPDRKYLYNEGFSRADTLYNEDALYVSTEEPVLVVEGVFDTFPFWPNAVAVLGKPSWPQVAMLLNARRPVCVVMDGDAWQEGEMLARGLRLRGKHAVSLKLDPGVDPDEVPLEVLAAARAALVTAA